MSDYKNTQSGRSMIEVIGYMGAVMAIVAGISKIISGAYNEYKLSQSVIQISDLSGAIVKASAVSASYVETVDMINGKSENDTLNKEGLKIIPSSFRVVKGSSGNSIYHAFGGRVNISVPDDADSNQFAITFEGLTRDQCIELGMKNWERNTISDLYSIVINNQYHWFWPIYTTIGSEDFTLPTKRSALTGVSADDNGQCNKPRNTNQIMWVFN